MIHNIIWNEKQNIDLPVNLYLSLTKNFFSSIAVLFPSILITYLTFTIYTKHHKIAQASVGLIIALALFIIFIWSSAITFKRLLKNVKYWGTRESVITLTAIGIDYLDIFSLQWSDVVDVKLYDWATGGRNNITVSQIVVVTSAEPKINPGISLEHRIYKKHAEIIKSQIKVEYPDFPIERTVILDPRGLNCGAQKLAEIIKQCCCPVRDDKS
jgi:hypothetical protein